MYFNAEFVLDTVLDCVRARGPGAIQLVVCDLSASPYLDLAGSHMLHELHSALAGRGISLRIIGAHGTVRDLLRADGLGEKTDGIDRLATLEEALRRDAKKSAMERPLSRPRSPI